MRGLAFLGVMIGSLLACSGSDTTGVPPFVATDPYYALRLNVRAAVMSTVAPYDTLQFSVTAYDVSGAVINLPGPVVYSVSDTLLSVTPTGLLTIKHKTGSSSFVIAKVQDTVLRVTHADTAYILATTTVPTAPIAHMSIQPVAGDSAVLNYGAGTKTLHVSATDVNNNPISVASTVFVAHFASSDVTIASVQPRTGVVTAAFPGTAMLTASTSYYGVPVSDSLQFTIGQYLPLYVITTLPPDLSGAKREVFAPDSLNVPANAGVIFDIPYDYYFNVPISGLKFSAAYNDSALSVVFDDSTNVDSVSSALLNYWVNHPSVGATNGSGNITIQIPADSTKPTAADIQYQDIPYLDNLCIEDLDNPCAAARSFKKPGKYYYHSPLTGATGVIVVGGA